MITTGLPNNQGYAMNSLYPLQFQPILRQYIWGGRRLGTLLGKPIGADDDYAESWEVVDRGPDQSVVRFGPLQGVTLGELVGQRGAELLGRHHPRERFPLLLKYLDANRDLSIQVHPDDARAAKLDPPDLGKTEAWVVLQAEPGSRIYAGLKKGVDRAALAAEVARGNCQACLHSFEPKPGDSVFLPAGVVHALGKGLLVGEIQQASDTTYRLFDWNRVGADGKPRTLHVEQALETIDYGRGPSPVQTARPTDRPHVERLVACDKFVLDRWQFDTCQPLATDDRCHLVTVLQGSVLVERDASSQAVARGATVLIPAASKHVALRPQRPTVLLDIYLP